VSADVVGAVSEVATRTFRISLALGTFCLWLEVLFSSHVELMVVEISLHILDTDHHCGQQDGMLNVPITRNVLN
jgi:hypothetical protein